MNERTKLTLLMQEVGWVEGPYYIDKAAGEAVFDGYEADLKAQLHSLTEENERLRALLKRAYDDSMWAHERLPNGHTDCGALDAVRIALSPIDPPLGQEEDK